MRRDQQTARRGTASHHPGHARRASRGRDLAPGAGCGLATRAARGRCRRTPPAAGVRGGRDLRRLPHPHRVGRRSGPGQVVATAGSAVIAQGQGVAAAAGRVSVRSSAPPARVRATGTCRPPGAPPPGPAASG